MKYLPVSLLALLLATTSALAEGGASSDVITPQQPSPLSSAPSNYGYVVKDYLSRTEKRSDALFQNNQSLLDRANKLMDRQQAAADRYEKILDTWERQQAQYQKYLDSLPTAAPAHAKP